jgi:hypothetical protein
MYNHKYPGIQAIAEMFGSLRIGIEKHAKETPKSKSEKR